MYTKFTILALLLGFNTIAKEYFASVTFGELSVKVTLNDETNKARIEMTGPSNKWFAVGFGNKSMNNTYTIFANESADETVAERILGNWNYGSALTSSTTLESFNKSGSTSTYIIERPLIANNGGYTFNAETGNVDIILAVGPNQNPNTYHGGTRAGVTINFVELNPTSSTNLVPNKFMKAYPNPASSVLNIEWSDLSPLTQLKITTVEGKNVQDFSVENAKNYTIDISSLSVGTYFLVVQNTEWRSYFTFIKE